MQQVQWSRKVFDGSEAHVLTCFDLLLTAPVGFAKSFDQDGLANANLHSEVVGGNSASHASSTDIHAKPQTAIIRSGAT